MAKNLGGIDSPANESQGGTNATTFNQARTNMGLNALINAQTIGYTATTTDRNKLIHYSGAGGVTLAFDPAATLLNGWSTIVRNDAATSITLNPDGAELINGAATLSLEPTQAVIVYCDGTAFYTEGEAVQRLALSGGTMTGLLILSGDPVTALGAATKQYVDAISSGFDFKTPCFAASTADLNATYLNGVLGVGATLTNAGSLVAFSIDGTSPSLNARILVKDQTNTFENGIYTLTTVGSGAVAWVLTRATDYDQSSEIAPGDFVIVTDGTINAGTGWVETAIVTTMGTDPILFTQFGGGDFAPIDATYLVVSNDATLPNERAFAAGGGLKSTDGGAGSSFTLDANQIVNAQTGGYTATTTDRGKVIRYTGAGGVTLALDPAATLTNGWFTTLRNDSSGTITIDPDGAETIDGASTLAVEASQAVIIFTNGTLFYTVGQASSAPANTAQYLTLATDSSLANERVFTPGGGVSGIDGGAGNPYTLQANEIYNAQTGGYTATTTDRGKVIYYTGAGGVTLALDPAATLTNGWFTTLRNSSSGIITVDPNGAETINGVASIAVAAGQAIIINCNGSLFTTVGEYSSPISSAQFLTLATDSSLPNERVFTPGSALQATDGGAGGNYTLFGAQIVNAQTSGYTATTTDRGKVIRYTGGGGVTLALDPAATLTNGWYSTLRNDSSGLITIDPNGGETINGASTLVVSPGQCVGIYTNGTLFYTIGEAAPVAPVTAQFLTLATDSTLTNERVFTPGGGLSATDAGAGSTYTLFETRVVNAQSSGYTAVASDRGKVIYYTGAGGVTLALDPAATLTNGWYTVLRNDSSGTITVDPNSSETINGATTLAVNANTGIIIFCNGSLFYTVGLNENPITVSKGGTGVQTLTTAYGVLCAGTTATGPVQTLGALGASGTVLTSNGAAALPSFQTNAGASAGLVFIASATASNSATVNFDNNLSATYDNYLVVFENVVASVPGTGVQLRMRVGTGGTPTYQTTNYLGANEDGTSGGFTGASSGTVSILFHTAASTASRVSGGFAIITNANSATLPKCAQLFGNIASGSSQLASYSSAVWNDTTTAISSLQFSYVSNNVSTGTFKLYGFKNS